MNKLEKLLLLIFIFTSQVYFTFAVIDTLKPETAMPRIRQVILIGVIAVGGLFVRIGKD